MDDDVLCEYILNGIQKENIIRWNRGIILCDVWIIIVLIIMQLSCMNDNGNNNVYAHMEMLVKSTLNPKLCDNFDISMWIKTIDYLENMKPM